jgi:hypothetical protein
VNLIARRYDMSLKRLNEMLSVVESWGLIGQQALGSRKAKKIVNDEKESIDIGKSLGQKDLPKFFKKLADNIFYYKYQYIDLDQIETEVALIVDLRKSAEGRVSFDIWYDDAIDQLKDIVAKPSRHRKSFPATIFKKPGFSSSAIDFLRDNQTDPRYGDDAFNKALGRIEDTLIRYE